MHDILAPESRNLFTFALASCDIELLRRIEKSDLHCHCGRSGDLKQVNPHANYQSQFNGLKDCEAWYKNNIRPFYKDTAEDKYKLIEYSFKQLARDNIRLTCMNFGISNIKMFGGIEAFVTTIKTMNNSIAPNCTVLPELGIQRQLDLDKIDNIEEIISCGFFYSIDLNGDEKAKSVFEFRHLFAKAREAKLVLKAHVGEFGTPDDIIEAIEVLNLTEINHGVSCYKSDNAMRYLLKKNIVLHISPTSNVKLGVFNNLNEHPIGSIYRKGIPVTICSDDQLLFDSEISKEYIRLYKSNSLEINELLKIWEYGLTYNHKDYKIV